MRKKPPHQASPDEVRITREGETAIIEFADPGISVSRVRIGPTLATMTDDEVLDLFNAMLAAQAEIAAEFDRMAVEIPPGRLQIAFHEDSGQWVLRGQVLCSFIEGAACKTLIDSERRKNTRASNDVRARQLVRF